MQPGANSQIAGAIVRILAHMAECLLMEWSGRAPTPPVRDAGRGWRSKEHSHVQTVQSDRCYDGIDIGKNSFHVVGLDRRGAIVLRQKWSRGQVEVRLAAMPPCLIGMEACVGAHHLSRKLQAHGHDARLVPAKYVCAYSKGQKNDFRDAEPHPLQAMVGSSQIRGLGGRQ